MIEDDEPGIYEPDFWIISLLYKNKLPNQKPTKSLCKPEQNLAIELIVGGLINVQNRVKIDHHLDVIWELDYNWAVEANTGFEIWCGLLDMDPEFIRSLFKLALKGKLTELNTKKA